MINLWQHGTSKKVRVDMGIIDTMKSLLPISARSFRAQAQWEAREIKHIEERIDALQDSFDSLHRHIDDRAQPLEEQNCVIID